MALIPHTALDCVVAIGTRDNGGSIVVDATGFLYGRLVAPRTGVVGDYGIFLITNRHVFTGRNRVALRFNPPIGSPGKIFDLDLIDPNGGQLWDAHSDPDIDIAVIPINAKLLEQNQIQFSAFADDSHILKAAELQTSGISEGDGVFVLGFPLGDAGRDRNHVIVRHGIVARIRDYLAGSAKTFLIDSTVFPGNSGGPVLCRPEGTAIAGTKILTRSMVLGLVSSYVPYQDVAVSQQTKRPRIIFEENTGLTYVQPIQFVSDLVETIHKRNQSASRPA